MDINRCKLAIVSLFMITIFFCLLPLNASARGIKVKIKASENVSAPVVGEANLYGNSYALVIGIDKYTHGWPRLSGAVNDAKLVAAELRQKGFDVTLKTNLDSKELKKTFEEFFILKGNDPKTRLFVWFAGHGHTLNGEGFLIPSDAPLPQKGAQFRLKALSMRRFGEYVRLAQSKHALAVFDSCFSGTIFDTQRTAPPPAITRATTLPVRQFLTSGDTDQKVSDDGRFRKLFIRAIRGEERADANQDGYVTGSELGLFLTDRLTNLTRSRQTPRYGKLRDEDYDRGDFVFLLASSGAVIEKPAPVSSKAYLSVESNVSTARVLIDGRYVGTTNLTNIEVSPGDHQIRIEKDGYEPYSRRIGLEKGRNRDLYVILDPKVPLKGRLSVNTQPDNARVRILNIGPKFFQGIVLDAGRYHVEVSAEGYKTQKMWVTLGSGEDRSIDVKLKKRVVTPSSSYISAKDTKTKRRFIAFGKKKIKNAASDLKFTLIDIETVKDTKTGLMWAAKDNGEDINWEDAKRYCENYRGGGYTDWRMPTQDELAELYDRNESYQPEHKSYNVHLTRLIRLTSCCPWASEKRDLIAGCFLFSQGLKSGAFPSDSYNYRALPVRSAK